MGKQNLYDHSIRVPLVLRGPGLPAGAEVEALCYSFDLFPTLCALADLEAPVTVEGQDLVPLAKGSGHTRYETVFALYDDIQRAVSDGEWKLIRYYPSARRRAGSDRTQLFRLRADPWEVENLAASPEHQSELERLHAALAAWRRRVDDPLGTAG